MHSVGDLQGAFVAYHQAVNPPGKRDEDIVNTSIVRQIEACCNIKGQQRLDNSIHGVLNRNPSPM